MKAIVKDENRWEQHVQKYQKDAMYHSKCLLALYRRSNQKSCVLDDNENDFEKQVHDQVLAELVFYMKQTANERR